MNSKTKTIPTQQAAGPNALGSVFVFSFLFFFFGFVVLVHLRERERPKNPKNATINENANPMDRLLSN